MIDTSNLQLPAFLCIGAQKAATSWLWVMLRQHPGIWMPPIKELHFFDHLFVPDNRSWTHEHLKKGVSDALKWHVHHEAMHLEHFKYLVDLAMAAPFTEDWYRACFNRPAAKGKVLGDITPEYCTLPDEGVAYTRKLLGPNLRLIYLIRNPVDRALSQLKMNLTRRGQEGENEAFWLDAAKSPVILQRGDYRTYIPRWERHFPKSNILYLPYKQVKENPASLLSAVEDHLGVAHHANFQDTGKRIHRTKEASAPQQVHDYLEEALAPQRDFLLERFGKAFYQQT